MAQLTPRLEAKSKELMVATAAAKAAAAEVEALEGEFEEPVEEYIWLKQRARARNCTHLYMNP